MLDSHLSLRYLLFLSNTYIHTISKSRLGLIMADITPSKKGYIRVLKAILNHSTCQEDINWCQIELDRVLGIEE